MDTFRFPAIAIKFNEDDVRNIIERQGDSHNAFVPDRVQLLRTGTFYHPTLGEINVTADMLQSMVVNYENKVRGVDIAIDYKHESDDIAAGWVKELELSDQSDGSMELWAVVSWTPKGLRKLHEKEFRYLSADFAMDYQDNETLEKFGPTLFGAGLTNRPVVKRMQPAIALMEKKPTEDKMDVKELEKQLAELKESNVKLSEQVSKLEEEKELEKKEMEDKKEEMQEDEDEDGPEMSLEEMKKELATLKEENAKLKEAAQLAEKNKKFDILLSEGKAVEAQRKAFITGDVVKFSELSGEVNFSASGRDADKKGDDEKDAEEKVLELAEKVVSEKKVSLDEAIGVVLSENAELRKQYEKPFAV